MDRFRAHACQPAWHDRVVNYGASTLYSYTLPCIVEIITFYQRPRGTRFFHNIATVILATATLAYFAMASDLGATPITAEFSHGRPGTRQIWVRNTSSSWQLTGLSNISFATVCQIYPVVHHLPAVVVAPTLPNGVGCFRYLNRCLLCMGRGH